MERVMSEVSYLSALVLGGLFAWAGTAKLLGGPRTVRTFRGLGLPAPERLAVAVPLLELGLAVGLVVLPRPAAVVALVTLTAFSAVLLRAVRSGVSVGCGCFGSAGRGPVSTVELVRNAFLVGAAVVAIGAHPAMPGLPAVLVASTAVAMAALLIALADLKRITGHVWAMDLPQQ